MRSPLPLPAATPRQALASKPARKAAAGSPANRAARKATSAHDNATTHKSSRRKGASNDTTKSAADNKKDAALDFAAMLAQNAAQPATEAPATGYSKGSSQSGTDAASALLRPQALAAAVDTGAGDATDDLTAAATAADAAANADATTEMPAPEPATDAAAASESDAAAALAGGQISLPSELVSAAHNLTANTADVVAGAHRQDAHDIPKSSDLSSGTTAAQEITDAAATAASTGTDAAHTGSEQSAGDQPGAGQPQPDLAGAAAAAGVQHSATGGADAVSETPMPAHTVAPTIAQVAQSLRTSGDGTSRLVIRLDPVELGPVLVSLRTRGGAVDISVRADNAGGAAAVADQRAHIQQVLADHGLDLSSFNVSGGEASGDAGSSTTDAGTSDSSGDGSPNGNAGSDASAANYADVQAQANGADGQGGDRRAFAAPQDGVGAFRTTAPTSSTDGAAEAAVRTVRREGTWL